MIADALRGVALIGVAVPGKSLVESVLRDWGIRSLLNAGGDLEDLTSFGSGDLILQGDGGGSDTVGDFRDGAEEKAGLVAVDGCEVGDGSNVNFGKLPPALTGLVNTGVRAFKNSVYADGVGMGLSPLSSCLITRGLNGFGFVWISEGKVNDLGVFKG